MTPCEDRREYSSFRDPSGCIFTRDGVLYRRIEPCYFGQYRRLMDSGLYAELQKFGALVAHEETERGSDAIVIRPQKVPYISYPYEWCFGELKDAALLTLKIHRRALRHDMILKDASAYNIQFINGRPMLIDTLSFDFYTEGEPWGAYGQFCRHFLAPLLLMKEKDVRLNRLLSLFIDGIPLDMTAELLGGRGGLLAKEHIVWHANSVAKHNEDGRKSLFSSGKKAEKATISRQRHLALIESLIRGIEGLKLGGVETEWGDYYAHTNYSEEAGEEKARSPLREFLYVDDAAIFCIIAMNKYNGNEIINVGTGKEISIKELAELVAEIVGYKGEILWDTSKPNGTPRKVLDVSKATALGWTYKTELREGIKLAYEDFLNNPMRAER